MEDLLKRLQLKCKVAALDFEDEILTDSLYDAIDAVNERRGFTPTETTPYEIKYKSLIVKLAYYALTKIGAEGETTHQENGIYRVYQNASDYPDDLMNEIIPLIKT